MRPPLITTDRLVLLPASSETIRMALDGDASLAAALDAVLPPDWPPEFYDVDFLTHVLGQLDANPESAPWGTHFFVRRDDRVLVGNGGYYAPPSKDGTVEVGYSVVSSLQQRGYATEATRGLVERAFADPRVQRVIASTLPDRLPSIRVLEKLGFEPVEPPSRPGVIQFVLPSPTAGAEDPRPDGASG